MKKGGVKVVASNRRSRHEFFIEDTIEAGIVHNNSARLTPMEYNPISCDEVNCSRITISIL